jgi:hypothetical protein
MNYDFQDNWTKIATRTFLNWHIQQSTVVFQVCAEIINESKCCNCFGSRQESVKKEGLNWVWTTLKSANCFLLVMWLFYHNIKIWLWSMYRTSYIRTHKFLFMCVGTVNCDTRTLIDCYFHINWYAKQESLKVTSVTTHNILYISESLY